MDGYRPREPWLQLEQVYAEAMPLDRAKPGQVGMFSWFAERPVSSGVVIGTV